MIIISLIYFTNTSEPVNCKCHVVLCIERVLKLMLLYFVRSSTIDETISKTQKGGHNCRCCDTFYSTYEITSVKNEFEVCVILTVLISLSILKPLSYSQLLNINTEYDHDAAN